MAHANTSLLAGCLVGFALLGGTAVWDHHIQRLSSAQKIAWMGSHEGEAYLSCLTRPLVRSIGGQAASCSTIEMAELHMARERSAKVSMIAVARSMIGLN